MEEDTLEHKLSQLLNFFSSENGSNTPDFILALYMIECLKAFNNAVNHRETWYGRKLKFSTTETVESDKD